MVAGHAAAGEKVVFARRRCFLLLCRLVCRNYLMQEPQAHMEAGFRHVPRKKEFQLDAFKMQKNVPAPSPG